MQTMTSCRRLTISAITVILQLQQQFNKQKQSVPHHYSPIRPRSIALSIFYFSLALFSFLGSMPERN